jgi:protein-L-isoaspartate(D-aspartate) O-methyltransferase
VAPVICGTAGAGQQALMVIDKMPDGVRQTLLEPVHFVPLKSGVA